MGEHGVVLWFVTQSAFTIHTEKTTAALIAAAAPAAAEAHCAQIYNHLGS